MIVSTRIALLQLVFLVLFLLLPVGSNRLESIGHGSKYKKKNVIFTMIMVWFYKLYYYYLWLGTGPCLDLVTTIIFYVTTIIGWLFLFLVSAFLVILFGLLFLFLFWFFFFWLLLLLLTWANWNIWPIHDIKCFSILVEHALLFFDQNGKMEPKEWKLLRSFQRLKQGQESLISKFVQHLCWISG